MTEEEMDKKLESAVSLGLVAVISLELWLALRWWEDHQWTAIFLAVHAANVFAVKVGLKVRSFRSGDQ